MIANTDYKIFFDKNGNSTCYACGLIRRNKPRSHNEIETCSNIGKLSNGLLIYFSTDICTQYTTLLYVDSLWYVQICQWSLEDQNDLKETSYRT
jgi:hypothetical protein